MSYHPRIESNEVSWFVTTRTQGSRLWFVQNKGLERAILGYAAKYTERYKAKLYGLAIEGSHEPRHLPSERFSVLAGGNTSRE